MIPKNIKAFLLTAFLFSAVTISGCESAENESQPKDSITYSYEDADATITDIDVRHWFATCPRWQWDITVSYDGLTYTDTGWANGLMNCPSFADAAQGDIVSVEVTTEYINGVPTDRYISKIH